MLKKHNKHGPMTWFAGVLAAAGLLLALPVSKPVYAAGDSGSSDATTIQTAYVGFSAVSDVKVNDVSVERYGHYKLMFDGNGADAGSTIGKHELEFGESYTLPANGFTRKGYTFKGWNTKADGTGTSYKDKASVTNLANGENDVTVTLYAQWDVINYTITYDLDGHGKIDPSWPTTYNIESGTISIGDPAGLQDGVDHSGTTPIYFTGWTGTDISGYPSSFVISRGSTGNRTFKATWNAGGFRISCEDWNADYNGNPYSMLGDSHSPDYAKPGTVVSGSNWGDNTDYSHYYTHRSYHSCTSVKVTNKNETVYRLFWGGEEIPGRIWTRQYNGNNVGFTVGNQGKGITIAWHDRKGNVLHTEKLTGHIGSDGYYYGLGPDGVTISIDPASIAANDNGKTLIDIDGNGSSNVMIRWHGGEDDAVYYVSFQQVATQWSEKDHMFVRGIADMAGTAYSDMTLTVNGTPKKVTEKYSLTGNYENGAKIRFTGITLKEGWFYNNGDFATYYGTGPGKYEHVNLWENTIAVDAPMIITAGEFMQDAYGVTFDANGGVGTHMEQVCIENTGSASDRTLPKCTYTNSNRVFLGWSTDPNASKPEYTDGAVMPKNLAGPCEYVRLYAVWGRSSGAKKNTKSDSTTFVGSPDGSIWND